MRISPNRPLGSLAMNLSYGKREKLMLSNIVIWVSGAGRSIRLSGLRTHYIIALKVYPFVHPICRIDKADMCLIGSSDVLGFSAAH